MKTSFLTLLAACTLCAATAQTNQTPAARDANGGGPMNNRNTGVDDGRMPPAGRDGARATDASMKTTDDATLPVTRPTDDRRMMRSDDGSTIGGMSRAEFDRMNMEANKKVAAITVTSAPLSKQDEKLLSQMAMGATMQLKMSQAAVGRVQGADVKVLAQSELEEQTGLNNKLVEIARAKGMSLSAEDGAGSAQILERMEQESAGRELDEYYVRNSGVRGHEKLMKTGEKVMREAQDPALKALAEATAPVIKMHMSVSQQILDSMGKGMSGGSR